MASYAAEARDVADLTGCAYLDLQSFFGDAPADYGPTSPRPFLEADNLHPTELGSRAMSAAITRALLDF
jgi:lysophospholipase L1-like esterase